MTRHFARRFRLLLMLRSVLGVAGALLWVGAIAALAAPDGLWRAVGVPLRIEPFFGWLLAAFLAPLGGIHFLAARDPRRYSGVIILAIAAHLSMALAFGAGALRPDGGELWLPAGTALAFATATAAAWLPLRV